MALGRVPGLAIDRTGVALAGLIVLLASGELSLAEAGRAIDMPTITLPFALVIVSAQFQHSGFYGFVAERGRSRASHSASADFARSGIPLTLVSLASTVAWLWLAGLMLL